MPVVIFPDLQKIIAAQGLAIVLSETKGTLDNTGRSKNSGAGTRRSASGDPE